mmetsp:Transcript_52993/g.134430  ORF Transcript_52993/g.134430 Transcript_52993/m.134430 type:complete len:148 (-) Transcript_52993:152-595(-)
MCILAVQMISKWASPDMFAYMLLMYLVGGLDHPPTLKGVGQLDLGFRSFALFCIFSTVASLGIQAPELPTSETAPAVTSEPTPLRRKLRSRHSFSPPSRPRSPSVPVCLAWHCVWTWTCCTSRRGRSHARSSRSPRPWALLNWCMPR